MKILVMFLGLLAACVLLFAGSFLFWQERFTASLIPPFPKEDSLSLLFVGDIMLDRGVEWHIKQNNDWNWPFLNAADSILKADIAFGNLESVISDKGEKQGSIYSFRAEPKTIQGLSYAGFDVLSVTNNHSLDFGIEALKDSIQRLKTAGIVPVGGGKDMDEAHAPALFLKNNTTIAFLAYTQVGSPFWQAGKNTPGIAWMDTARLAQLKKDIEAAKARADIVVVSFHFGKEYQKEPSETQRLLATKAVEYGADLVVGHHPHVVQALQQYKGKYIAWSLGNFVFDQGFSKETMEGMMLKVLVKEKNISQVMPIAVQLSPTFQPAIKSESTK